jgi:hypothetical protein
MGRSNGLAVKHTARIRMPRFFRYTPFILVVLFYLTTGCARDISPKHVGTPPVDPDAAVLRVNGAAGILNHHKWIKASENMPLAPGTSIATAEGEMLISWQNICTARIGTTSVASLLDSRLDETAETSAIRIRLLRGHILVHCSGGNTPMRFEVTAPWGAAGLPRGEMAVDVLDGQTSRVFATRGKAELTLNGRTLNVPSGSYVEISGAGMEGPAVMSAALAKRFVMEKQRENDLMARRYDNTEYGGSIDFSKEFRMWDEVGYGAAQAATDNVMIEMAPISGTRRVGTR